jgi:integrase
MARQRACVRHRPGHHLGRPENAVNHHLKPLLRRAGLPDIRWHDLRHTCATLLLSRSTHPKLVQHPLGPTSIQLTLEHYSH